MCAELHSSASSTRSSGAFSRVASSATLGARPSSWVSSVVVRPTWVVSSCSPRVTCTAQVRSRKCRRISPSTVGEAYVVNSRPRAGSKRSMALISPIEPTWTRSSSGSPRPAYRRAKKRTSGRCSSTSSVRTR